MKEYYVYRFLDKDDNIIYIGKTNNMKVRMNVHFSNKGHLSYECYSDVELVEYIKMNNQIDMDIKELYYINKWKPKYNIKDKIDENISVEINENENWIIYTTKQKEKVQKLNDKIEELESKLKSKNNEIDKLNKIIDDMLEYVANNNDISVENLKFYSKNENNTFKRNVGKKSTVAKRYGKKIDERLEQGKSQRQIAEELGISRTTIHNYLKIRNGVNPY